MEISWQTDNGFRTRVHLTGKSDQGFALLESLIALVILMVGLLGLMGLQTHTTLAQTEAYQRQQALLLLQDIVDRINANHVTAGCYVIANATGGEYLGTGINSPITCDGYGDATTQPQAVDDLHEWQAQLLGAGEQQANSSVGGMIGARGCITLKDPVDQIYTVEVAWQGVRASAAPVSTCAAGLYGDETKRRAISVDVRVANLTAP